MKSELTSVEAIAKDIFNEIDEQTLLELFDSKHDSLIFIHFRLAFKMWIRNFYGLWGYSPLTKEWREHPEKRHIVDGVDWSKDHPEQISEEIFERVKVLYENGYCRQSQL